MPRLGDLANSDYGYSDLGVPIGATVGEPKVTDYGQADLRPFAMGALGQQDAYRPTSAQGTDLWGYQMGGTVVPPQEIDKAINMVMATSGGGLATKGIKAYHSSPHDFDKFDLKKIGTGEGAQAYGHGLYFAENPAVSGQGGQYWNQFKNRFSGADRGAASTFQKTGFDREQAAALTRTDIEQARRMLKEGFGSMQPGDPRIAQALATKEAELRLLESGAPVGPRTYEVNIKADPAQMLDWDKPLREQRPGVAQGLSAAIDPYYGKGFMRTYAEQGNDFKDIIRNFDDLHPANLSRALDQSGIPGIKYLDEGSRGIQRPTVVPTNTAFGNVPMLETIPSPKQTHNYVVFDPDKIDILKKYGIAGAAPAGIGALAAQDYYRNP